jgi:hypothetical protein
MISKRKLALPAGSGSAPIVTPPQSRKVLQLQTVDRSTGWVKVRCIFILPELKTVHGTHYADVLEKLNEQQSVRLQNSAEQPDANPGIAKAISLLPHPKRIRDASHLHFVASLPCLVCDRTPAQGHHCRNAPNFGLRSNRHHPADFETKIGIVRGVTIGADRDPAPIQERVAASGC